MRSGCAVGTCVDQGECDAADGWVAAPPLPVWARSVQNDGAAAQGEIQQVNNEDSHPATHPLIRSLQPRNHSVCLGDSTPKENVGVSKCYQQKY